MDRAEDVEATDGALLGGAERGASGSGGSALSGVGGASAEGAGEGPGWSSSSAATESSRDQEPT